MRYKKRLSGGKIKISVLGWGEGIKDIQESESWGFFEKISNEVVNNFATKFLSKNDGPDSSRWSCAINEVLVFLEFDDLLGTTIVFDSDGDGELKTSDDICDFLGTLKKNPS
ncbi:hypothetical protein ACVBEJ_12955 [Porticoccus sp. GXU_MW_L64]